MSFIIDDSAWVVKTQYNCANPRCSNLVDVPEWASEDTRTNATNGKTFCDYKCKLDKPYPKDGRFYHNLSINDVQKEVRCCNLNVETRYMRMVMQASG